jgi:hypothetical protein
MAIAAAVAAAAQVNAHTVSTAELMWPCLIMFKNIRSTSAWFVGRPDKITLSLRLI